MSTVFLSTLGTSAYQAVVYKGLAGEEPSPATPYIQEARLHALRGQIDRVLICATEGPEGSIERNWRQRIVNPRDQRYEPDGLRQRLEALGYAPELLPIPAGSSETELWEIFATLRRAIHRGDTLHVDITHGFRSQAIVLMTALDYLQRAQEVRVVQITYGAYEAVPRASAAARPTFDLTPFFVLRDWTAALALLEAGDLRALGRRLDEALHPLKRILQRDFPSSLRRLPGRLISLGEALWNNRLRALPDHVSSLVSLLVEGQKDLADLREAATDRPALQPLVGALEPFGVLLRTLQDTAQGLCPREEDPPEVQGLLAAGFCFEHGMMVQGYTFLRESLVDHIDRLLPEALSRQAADNTLGWLAAHKSPPPNPAQLPHFALLLPPCEGLGGEPHMNDLRPLVQAVTQTRNKLLHAGTKDSVPRPQKLGPGATAHLEEALRLARTGERHE